MEATSSTEHSIEEKNLISTAHFQLELMKGYFLGIELDQKWNVSQYLISSVVEDNKTSRGLY